MSRLLRIAAVFGLLLDSYAHAFSFTTNTTSPASCGSMTFNWTGGSPPFALTIIPAFDYPSNATLPDSAWSAGTSAGSYRYTVNYPKGTRFVAMMSDASGIGSGGVSPLYTVGDGSPSCGIRSTATDFLFYLNRTTASQCSPMQVYWDNSAIAPVKILGVIPGGQPFELQPRDPKATSLVWNTNIAAGTSFILAAFDNGPHGQGGSSDLLTVGGSGNDACLDSSAPSSTPVAVGTATPTGGGGAGGAIKTVTAIATAPPAQGSSGLSGGAIAGIVLAVVLSLLVLQGLLFWFCCRRQISALLTHKKQMRGRGNPSTGELDLVSSRHGASTAHFDDSPASETGLPMSRRASSLFGGGGGTRRSRTVASEVATDTAEMEDSISPFWDGARAGDLGTMTTVDSGVSGHGPFSSRSELLPPVSLSGRSGHSHNRHDSLDSGFSRPLSMELPYLSSVNPQPMSPVSPVGASSPASTQYQRSALSRPSKAQLAAANPDDDDRPRGGSGSRSGDADLLPPDRHVRQEAPSGGFRRHEDAGAVDDVEDLPPMYRPEWDGRSNPRHSGGGV